MMQSPRFSALVVDDDPIIRQYVMRALARESFRCDGAANGVEASAAMDRATYDVVVCDLYMPIKNGHALAVEILAMPTPPVLVMLTGIAEPRIEEDLRQRGVNGIVHKPVNLAIFSKCISKLALKRQEMITPHLDADIPAALQFLNMNFETPVENKYKRQEDYWNLSQPRSLDAMKQIDGKQEEYYSYPTCTEIERLSSPPISRNVLDDGKQPSPHQNSSSGSSVLSSSFTIPESREVVAPREPSRLVLASVPETMTPISEVLPIEANGTSIVLNTTATLPMETSRLALASIPETVPTISEVMPIERIAVSAAPEPTPTLQVGSATGLDSAGLATTVANTVLAPINAIKLPVGQWVPLQSLRNFHTVIWAFVGIVAFYLSAQLAIQLYDVRQHHASVHSLKALGATIGESDGGMAIGMQNQKVAEMLVLLQEVRALRALLLSQSDVTDEQLTLLKDHNELKTLDLDDTPVTDSGMDQLLKLKSLEDLNLSGTEVTEDKLKFMRRQKPNLRINHHLND